MMGAGDSGPQEVAATGPAAPRRIDWRASENWRVALGFGLSVSCIAGITMGLTFAGVRAVIDQFGPATGSWGRGILFGFGHLADMLVGILTAYLLSRLFRYFMAKDEHERIGSANNDAPPMDVNFWLAAIYVSLSTMIIMLVQMTVFFRLGAGVGDYTQGANAAMVAVFSGFYLLRDLLDRFGRLKPDATPGAAT